MYVAIHILFPANTDTCQPVLPYKVETLLENIDYLPTEFSVPTNAWPLTEMDRHSPSSPLLLSAPTRRPTSLGPPDYGGSKYPIHTAPNDSRLTRHEFCIHSSFTIYVTMRVCPNGPSICLLTQSLSSCPISTPQPSPPLPLHRQSHSLTPRFLVSYYFVIHFQNILSLSSIVPFRNSISSLHR